MTDSEIAEIESRCAAATAGPWHSLPSKLRPQYPTKINQVLAQDGTPIVAWSGFDDSDVPYRQHKANANFIAHARTDIESLLAALRTERGKVGELEARVRELEKLPRGCQCD